MGEGKYTPDIELLDNRKLNNISSCSLLGNFLIVAVVCVFQFKIRAILDAIQLAYIPWSPDMDSLVQEGLALKHPRSGIVL